MKRVSQRRGRRKKNFSFDAKRRNEILQSACYLGVADTEDFDRYLIAWYWHNPQGKDPIWSLMNAAGLMGRSITEEEASAIIEEASKIYRRRTADSLAKFLGLKYAVRQKLKIKTIGATDIKKRARKVLRKRADRIYREGRRRELGMKPWEQSLSRTQPWNELGMGRTKYYENKRRTEARTKVSAVYLYTADDKLVRREEGSEQLSSRTATLFAADGLVPMPPLYVGQHCYSFALPSEEYRAAA